MEKMCRQCKEVLELKDFNKYAKNIGGYYPYCKSCMALNRKIIKGQLSEEELQAVKFAYSDFPPKVHKILYSTDTIKIDAKLNKAFAKIECIKSELQEWLIKDLQEFDDEEELQAIMDNLQEKAKGNAELEKLYWEVDDRVDEYIGLKFHDID